MQSYRDLEIWTLARELAVDIHLMTLTALPKFQLYEEGCQIRRSSKSVSSNIVEGFGRQRYKQDYIRFLTYALASNDETTNHLELLFETDSLSNKELFKGLAEKLDNLVRKLNRSLQSVERQHNESSKD
ncbi:MAG: four helix bundle protein [Verrucomicrobiota bacterium]